MMQESTEKNSGISKSIFNQDIKEILEKSVLLGDDWKIFELFDGNLYLEKTEKKFIRSQNDIYTFIYHVIFSDSFSVPVLYLNVYKSNGKILEYDELYSYYDLEYKSPGDNDSSTILIITQQDHPYLYKPFYFLHPCKTLEWMSVTKIDSGQTSNFTLKWLSFVFASLNISLNLKYGLNKNDL
jgi:ubiquitin-like-conjugating enzyme ATG10